MNILNKLTIKHLKMNKKRTIVTIIGVVLSTALMVGIGLLLSTFREMMIQQSIESNGNYHISINDLDNEKLSVVEKNSNVEYIYSKGFITYAESDFDYQYKPYLKLFAVNENYLKELKLQKGTYPKKDNEILVSAHLLELAAADYKIGDEIKLYLGKRMLEGEEYNNEYFTDGETFERNGEIGTYKIVGIVERDSNESYSDPGFSIFTYKKEINNNIQAFIRFKKPKKAYEIADNLASTLNFKNECESANVGCYEEIHYNDALLSMYGASRYDNVMSSMSGVLSIMLAVVAVGCIIVIYNSFAISVMERKKQFGLFSSIGATKYQLKKTVFFEAIIVSIIGVPLGILSAYIGIGVVVSLMNILISDMVNTEFVLCTYPIFLIIPIVFMILTIFISAFLPARSASKITPIEAIRLNDDIKIKGRKLKVPKFITRIFSIEGEIALKNIKRNKKKYRITIASLFISIVMFVAFSSFLDYSFKGTSEYMTVPDFDFTFNYQKSEEKDKVINKLINHELVTDYMEFSDYYMEIGNDLDNMYSKKMKENIHETLDENTSILMIVINDNYYKEYLNQIGEKEDKPVLFNTYHGISYSNGSRVSRNFERYDKNKQEPLEIGERTWDDTEYNKDPDNYEPKYSLKYVIQDYYISSESNLITSMYESEKSAILFMSESYFEKLNKETPIYKKVVIKVSDNKAYDKESDEIVKTSDISDFRIFNISEEYKMIKNMVLMMQILVYGFISLVTLIGVTSVFNTINTSIALRRKEFAVLRSIGLTPKGFNKILYFESLFVGLKSLIYGLPFAFVITLLIHSSMSNMVEFNGMLIPYTSVIIAIVSVFVIVIITMMYASSKIKHENILEAIREENI